ncbi:MAG: diguanylate cyclase [Acidobacteria bacterium]|nr:diguanylate cyclase [Acidobacteriota bacterium]
MFRDLESRMKWDLKSSLSKLFAGMFLTLAVVSVLSYQNAQTLMSSTAWIAHSNQVLEELETMRREVTEIRRSQRDYAMGLVARELYPEGGLDMRLHPHIHNLRELVAADPKQLSRAVRLDDLVEHTSPEGRDDHRKVWAGLHGHHSAWEREMAHTQRVIDIIDSMKTEEVHLLRDHTSQQDMVATKTQRMIALLAATALLVFAVLYWLLLRNLRERASMQQALAASQALYKDLFDNTSDLIQVVSLEGRLIYTNRAWRNALKYEADETSQLYLKNVVHAEDLPYAEDLWMRLVAGETIEAIQLRLRTSEGLTIYVEGSGNCNYAEGEPVSAGFIYRDITERKRTEIELQAMQEFLQQSLAKEKELSRMDSLTVLPNRRAFYEALDVERLRSRRYGRPLTLAYLDLDNFKQVNDAWGHAAGDELLVTVASTIRNTLRSTDFLARLGGDEFAVILPESDAFAAQAVLRKLQAALHAALERRAVTVSIGAATFLNPQDSVEMMLTIADNTMYSVKKKGKNDVKVSILG